jgi:heme A synthase
MKLLLMFELSWRAVGRLIGVTVLALAALAVVALVASPGAAIAAGIGLLLLISAVVKAMKSDEG